jgi:hypothetical protein
MTATRCPLPDRTHHRQAAGLADVEPFLAGLISGLRLHRNEVRAAAIDLPTRQVIQAQQPNE